jgi:hypothetical protein
VSKLLRVSVVLEKRIGVKDAVDGVLQDLAVFYKTSDGRILRVERTRSGDMSWSEAEELLWAAVGLSDVNTGEFLEVP